MLLGTAGAIRHALPRLGQIFFVLYGDFYLPCDYRRLAYDKARRTSGIHHIDYGLGVFDRDVFQQLPEGQPYDLAQVYRKQLAAGQLAAVEVSQRFYEIGSPQGLQETAEYLRNLGSPSPA